MTGLQMVVIDPALRRPELDAFNALAQRSKIPLSYHLPAIFGFDSLYELKVDTIAGFIILGSAASVNERQGWQKRLEEWLRPHLERGIPALGLCYGHQMLAYMFGGKIARVYPDGSKYLQLRDVEFLTDLPSHIPQDWCSKRGTIVVSHQEHVVTVPEVLQVIAKSAEIAVDGLAHKTLPIISFQSHPEAMPATAKAFGLSLNPEEVQALAFGHSITQSFLDLCYSKVTQNKVSLG